MAEQIALRIAQEQLGAFRAFSEESGELQFGVDPAWTLVIDPCDGSNNFRRGVRSVGFAVAALPVGAPLDPALVEFAVCGDVFTGTVYSAGRGQGALLDGQPITSSQITDLRRAMVGVNLGRERSHGQMDTDEPTARDRTGLQAVWRILKQSVTVRRTGATVLDLCYVAHGAFDAYVDLRNRLTPENFLAPALVLAEAGAVLTNAHGEPIGPVEFTEPYSILAAGNETLLKDILDRLHG